MFCSNYKLAKSDKNAGKLMTRYNVNTLLVVDTKHTFYEGYITRPVVEKLLFHKLAGQPVREYMNHSQKVS